MHKKYFPYVLIFSLGILVGQMFPRQTFINPQIIPLIPTNYNLLSSTPMPTSLPGYTRVTKVIDGDTIEIETGQKVRYIGIDTPEIRNRDPVKNCFGKEALAKNRELIEGKKVQLKKDVSETDRYGRLLRYVYILSDNQTISSTLFINQYLLQEGYAYAATFPPDVAYADQFIKLEQNARMKQKGLWNKCKK